MKPLMTKLAALLLSGVAAPAQELRSPDGNLQMRFSLDEAGTPRYELRRGDKIVVKPSRMGFLLRGKGGTAQFGFFGVVVYTRVQTPRRWGHAASAGDLLLSCKATRPFRTNC